MSADCLPDAGLLAALQAIIHIAKHDRDPFRQIGEIHSIAVAAVGVGLGRGSYPDCPVCKPAPESPQPEPSTERLAYLNDPSTGREPDWTLWQPEPSDADALGDALQMILAWHRDEGDIIDAEELTRRVAARLRSVPAASEPPEPLAHVIDGLQKLHDWLETKAAGWPREAADEALHYLRSLPAAPPQPQDADDDWGEVLRYGQALVRLSEERPARSTVQPVPREPGGEASEIAKGLRSIYDWQVDNRIVRAIAFLEAQGGASEPRGRIVRNESTDAGKQAWANVDAAAKRAPQKAVDASRDGQPESGKP